MSLNSTNPIPRTKILTTRSVLQFAIHMPSPKNHPYYSHPQSPGLSPADTSDHLQRYLKTTTYYCLPRSPGLSAAGTSEHPQTSLPT